MQWRSVGGFTLVEVLVALFVLAVGIAGASAVQLAALRTRHHAELSMAATQIAAGLAERMRANVPQMALPDGANPYLELDYDAADGQPATPLQCHGDADCNPGQLAAYDLYETIAAVRASLPRGRIRACRDAMEGSPSWQCEVAAGAPVVIKLGWHANEGGADDVPRVAVMVAG